MTRFRLWFRWKYRFTRCLWLVSRKKCQSFADAFALVNEQFPLTFHEYVYDQMARERGRPPSIWDPPPQQADIISFMMLWAEHRYEGMSGQEILDEVNNAERERHEIIAAFVERAAAKQNKVHDLA